MKSSAKKVELASVDDLFTTEESRADAGREKVVEIPLSELHSFKGHPFKVKDDDAMMETADSIRQYGVLVPAIARPDPNGGYELVAGHRRHTVTPVLGEKAAHNGKVVYSLDFEVTPHQLRHTYITNLIHASVDPKTVQYLAGHESSKITMDIYAKVKYNRPDELVRSMSSAFAGWEAV